MRELAGERAEPGASANLFDQTLGGLADRCFLVRAVDRKKYFPEAVRVLALGLLEPGEDLIDFFGTDIDPRRQPAAHQPGPGDAGPHLRAERFVAHPVAPEYGREAARLHSVALLDVRDAPSDVVFGDRHVPLFRFLKLEALVDQRSQHLSRDPPPRVRGVFDPAGKKDQTNALPQIPEGDDLVVDDRGDPLLRLGERRRGRRDGGRDEKGRKQA